MGKKMLLFCFLALFTIANMITPVSAYTLPDSQATAIAALLKNASEKYNTPGISVAVIDGQETDFFSYGFADKESGIETTENTLYELASVSKAFTALGILLLEDEGKLNLNDPIQKYIPWLEVLYQNKPVDMSTLTIADFLYHKSGLTNFSHLKLIPEGTDSDMLQKTVGTLVGVNLDFLPSQKFEYGTVNYDVLGLVIESVTEQPYEDFMKHRILEPLGLHNTYLFESDARATGQMATGYKQSFLSAKPFSAPVYRGNKPAGYIISNAADMSRWLSIHMGSIEVPEPFDRILKKAHEADKSTASTGGGVRYAAGWFAKGYGTVLYHGGYNPSFVTHVYMAPAQNLAVCVLMNSASADSDSLSNIIIDIMADRPASALSTPTLNQTLDLYCTLFTIALSIPSLILMILICRNVYGIRKKIRRYARPTVRKQILMLPAVIFLLVTLVISMLFPRLSGFTWGTITPWVPDSVPASFMALTMTGILAFVQVALACLYPKRI